MLYIIVTLAAFAALVLFINARPAEFRISRSGVIPASPATVFGMINDLHQWERWSPWARLDPNARMTFEGPNAGVGAISRWDGNNKVGAGHMEITESLEPERVALRLTFLRPMQGVSLSEFQLRPEGEQTHITWTMSGTNNFMAKAMGLVMNCDKMVGGQFEQGLANMRDAVRNGQ